MLKVALTAATTAIVCFAIVVATGLASRASSEKNITVAVGDYVNMPSLDMSCFLFGSDRALDLGLRQRQLERRRVPAYVEWRSLRWRAEHPLVVPTGSGGRATRSRQAGLSRSSAPKTLTSACRSAGG